MHLSFTQIRRSRELVEVVARVAPVRREIAQLEQMLASSALLSAEGGGHAGVGRLRERVGRNELGTKRAELEALITRAEVLAGQIAAGVPAPTSAPAEPPREPLGPRPAPALETASLQRSALRALAAGLVGLGMVASFAAGTVAGQPAHRVPGDVPRMGVAGAPELSTRADERFAPLPPAAAVMGISTARPNALAIASPWSAGGPQDEAARPNPLQIGGGIYTTREKVDSDAAQADVEGREPRPHASAAAEAMTGIPIATLFTRGATGVNLREAPSLAAPIVEVLRSGTHVGMLEGRARADGLAWQRVRSPTEEVGWVAAGTVRQRP